MKKKIRWMIILQVVLAIILLLLALYTYLKGQNTLPQTEVFFENTTILGGFLR
ncbi:MAG: hypothetical protein ACOCQX_04610 [Candidatus Nanoarchaeia archaeon]